MFMTGSGQWSHSPRSARLIQSTVTVTICLIYNRLSYGGVGQRRSTMMKTFTIVAALLAGGVSLAIAQGPPTGGYPPVAGGAAGNPATNPGFIEY